ncbi:hypothetical protein DFP72DRAFT_1040523 [Ephemerocybe angulata]|uniref:F-box domain-containing protein n=1 Tax=Ephemerocybe angulata TaxID=980116 RepID=A0A8H6IG20_9AGAR|nr:hypothetical protein DFP72DRAFT_1040523 [Tulosesus angulatus]
MSSTALPMEHTSTLPQELIDNIVDYFPDDQETQKRLSRVNRSWSQRTRHNLFQTVSFELGGPNCARLNEVLQTNPSLYQHIQTMRIDHDRRYSLASSSFLGVIDPKQLVNVREISVHGDKESNLNWVTLPAGLRSALYDLLAKPDLTTLALMDIRDIDVSFIGRNLRLKELTLYGVNHTLSSSPSTSSDGPPAIHLTDEKYSLRSLSVGQCGDALQCLRAAATIVPQPVLLRVRSWSYDDKMEMALQTFSRNVETYEIMCVPTGTLTGTIGLPLHSGVLDFVRLPKLKTLTFNLHLGQLPVLLSGPSPTIPSPLVQQIARLRSANCLESINILVDLDDTLDHWTPSDIEQLLRFFFYTVSFFRSWQGLDNILGDKVAFSELKKVRIWLKIPTHAAPSKQQLDARVLVFNASVMPILSRRPFEYRNPKLKCHNMDYELQMRRIEWFKGHQPGLPESQYYIQEPPHISPYFLNTRSNHWPFLHHLVERIRIFPTFTAPSTIQPFTMYILCWLMSHRLPPQV